MRRPSTTVLVISTIVAAIAILGIYWFKPARQEAHVYRIGEQSLTDDEDHARKTLAETTVALIKDHPITAQEIAEALEQLPPFQRYYYSSPEKVQLFVQNYALVILLAELGREHGLETDPYVRMVMEDELIARYRQKYLAEVVKPSSISEQDIEAYLSATTASEAAETSTRELATGAKAAILEERRTTAWQQHLMELSNSTSRRK
jgi:hypothetical protein